MSPGTDFSRNEIEAFNKGYRINKDGVVKHLNKIVVGSMQNGYKQFGYRDSEHKNKHCKFHRLQAYQKFGDKIYEEGMVVRHLDGNPLNNTWDNIEIGTDYNNHMDIPSDVRMNIAIKATKAIIRWDYKTIRAMHDSGMSYSQIMKETGITSKGTLSYIINERYINRDDMT